jgi:hypothetical protein
LTDVSEIIIVSIIIALMMDAVRTFETSVKFYETTLRSIPDGCRLYNRSGEKLKSRSIEPSRSIKFGKFLNYEQSNCQIIESLFNGIRKLM